jgi:hypothetical protein
MGDFSCVVECEASVYTLWLVGYLVVGEARQGWVSRHRMGLSGQIFGGKCRRAPAFDCREHPAKVAAREDAPALRGNRGLAGLMIQSFAGQPWKQRKVVFNSVFNKCR